MKRSLVALAAATLSLQALSAASSSYTIVDLGENRHPEAVNDAGVLAGTTAHGLYALAYADGTWTRLPRRGQEGFAFAINAHGVIVGWNGDRPEGDQVRWKNGQREVLAGTHQGGSALGISDDGTIVGFDVTDDSNGHCYKWKDGVMTYLPDLGGTFCAANAIDPTGTYIGGAALTPSFLNRAFIIDGTGYHDLGTLKGGAQSQTIAVNRHGHAAVSSEHDSTLASGAAYWDGRKLVNLCPRPDRYSASVAINDADDVLVNGYDDQGQGLFLYSAATRAMTPIVPRIVNPQGWRFEDYNGRVLANDGTIYGVADFHGKPHAFKLVPSADQR